mgnify:FL=1
MSINENGDVIGISFNKEDQLYLKVRIIFENVDEVNLIEQAVFSNTVCYSPTNQLVYENIRIFSCELYTLTNCPHFWVNDSVYLSDDLELHYTE